MRTEWKSARMRRTQKSIIQEDTKMAETGHFVDFYETDEQFIAAAVHFLSQGFATGSSCIVVLTHDHRPCCARR